MYAQSQVTSGNLYVHFRHNFPGFELHKKYLKTLNGALVALNDGVVMLNHGM